MRSENTRQYLTHIGTNVSDLRKNARLSLEQLADRAVVNAMYLWSIEDTNRINMTVDTLVALADGLGVHPARLLLQEAELRSFTPTRPPNPKPSASPGAEASPAGMDLLSTVIGDPRARQIRKLGAAWRHSIRSTRAARASFERAIAHFGQALTTCVTSMARQDC